MIKKSMSLNPWAFPTRFSFFWAVFLPAIKKNNIAFFKNFFLKQASFSYSSINQDVLNIVSPLILFTAIQLEKTEIVQLLINQGVKVDQFMLPENDISNKFEEFHYLTPLHAAIKMNNEALVKMICEAMVNQNISFDIKETRSLWPLNPVAFANKNGYFKLANIISNAPKQILLREAKKIIDDCEIFLHSTDESVDIDVSFFRDFVQSLSTILNKANNILNESHIALTSQHVDWLKNSMSLLKNCFEFAKSRVNTTNREVDIHKLITLIKNYEAGFFNLIHTNSNKLATALLDVLQSYPYNEAKTISEDKWNNIIKDFEITDPDSFDLIWNSKLLFIYSQTGIDITQCPFSGNILIKNQRYHNININSHIPHVSFAVSRMTKLSRVDGVSVSDTSSVLEYKDSASIAETSCEQNITVFDFMRLEMTAQEDVIIETKDNHSRMDLSIESKNQCLPSISMIESKSKKSKLIYSHDDLFKKSNKSQEDKQVDRYLSSLSILHEPNVIKINLIKSYRNKFSKGDYPEFRKHILNCLADEKYNELMIQTNGKKEYSPLVITELNKLFSEALIYRDEKPLKFLCRFAPKELLHSKAPDGILYRLSDNLYFMNPVPKHAQKREIIEEARRSYSKFVMKPNSSFNGSKFRLG